MHQLIQIHHILYVMFIFLMVYVMFHGQLEFQDYSSFVDFVAQEATKDNHVNADQNSVGTTAIRTNC